MLSVKCQKSGLPQVTKCSRSLFFFFFTSKQISQYRQNVYEIKYKQLFMDFVKTKLSLF
jgi:hypothetical protein